jgi:hypothetical protein
MQIKDQLEQNEENKNKKFSFILNGTNNTNLIEKNKSKKYN